MLVFLCLKIKEHAKKPQREDVSYVFLGWLFKLVIKNQLNISKLLQKCKKCSKGLLKYLMIILREGGGSSGGQNMVTSYLNSPLYQ